MENKNEYLRRKVKELKLFQDISYTEIAELMEMNKFCFYNWLKKQYDFGEEKQNHLLYLVDTL